MRSNHGIKSIVLFAFSVLALLLLSVFESALVGLSITTERIISVLLLILPGLAGVAFGILGLVGNESRKWLAITGILLNGLFTMFMTFVLSLAG